MRKQTQFWGVFALSLSLVFLLCACGSAVNEMRILGTWSGGGDLDLLGLEAPFEFARQWTFSDDGTATALVDSENVEFTYSITDDTLTLSSPEMSWGVSYKIKGDTLTIDNAEFTKIG